MSTLDGCDDERGMTLLELVVAMTLFAMMLIAIAASLASGAELVRNNRNRSVAANLASQELDAVRTAIFSTLQPVVTTTAVDAVDYTVHRELTWVGSAATNGPCDGSTAAPQVLRVHVWVDWPNRRGVPAASADTELAPPVGAYDANTGHIAVKVIDRAAAPWDTLAVSISGPQARTLLTNSDGCAVFAFLPAGTYSVTLTKPGYVDRQGNASPTRSVGVSVGQMSSVQFDYDQAATLAVSLDAEDARVPNDVPVTVGNTTLVPTGTRTYTGTGTARSITGLFPASDGYAVWAGSCADADPEGLDAQSNPWYPGAQRGTRIATAPGSQASVSTALPPVRVTVRTGLGTQQGGVTVTAVHAADGACAAGETHTLGTTDSDGQLDAALPFGTWTIRVTGRSAATTWPIVALSPLDGLVRTDVTVVVT